MKLKMLRQHYQSRTDKLWIPKKQFKSEEEAQKKLGSDCAVYRCDFCDFLHVGRESRVS